MRFNEFTSCFKVNVVGRSVARLPVPLGADGTRRSRVRNLLRSVTLEQCVCVCISATETHTMHGWGPYEMHVNVLNPSPILRGAPQCSQRRSSFDVRRSRSACCI